METPFVLSDSGQQRPSQILLFLGVKVSTRLCTASRNCTRAIPRYLRNQSIDNRLHVVASLCREAHRRTNRNARRLVNTALDRLRLIAQKRFELCIGPVIRRIPMCSLHGDIGLIKCKQDTILCIIPQRRDQNIIDQIIDMLTILSKNKQEEILRRNVDGQY